ncbi:AsmA-like C-terminal domain-containing protein [Methyloceanibacter sp. wino2]|uniref:AsmA-like C-terminal domain-containing protein n=1 Tax=Methyloceanibacter sp. wino2 TaxID=2170729 RepID=UPI000D3E93FE|nr:AsmA-like C-terminal domain-containing protein [Methyloceanibacter sp. wino2]
MDEQIAGALAKITKHGGKAIRALPEQGRQLVKSVPAPVQIQLARLSSRGAHVFREIFAGIFVLGLIAVVLGYGRLSRGPISLPGLVAPIEHAINDQLTDLTVKIDDAVLQRGDNGPGVVLRLRDVRLIDPEGEVVAQAPLAAVGLSGSALLSGKIAAGSVDFIGSRLLMTYNEQNGLSLAFSKPGEDGAPLMRGPISSDPEGAEPPVDPAKSAKRFNLTNAVNEAFQRVRRSDTSYLTRFGLKDSIVVLYRDGAQTFWQVPDFALNLDHHDRRSVLVGNANVASSRGDWQLEVRTAQNASTKGLETQILVNNLVPSGIAGNFPTIGLLRALDMAVDGEALANLAPNGDFIGGEAKVRLAPGQITPPWDPDTPVRIERGELTLRYITETRVIELAPSTLRWGKDSHATFSGAFVPVFDDKNEVQSWTFDIKANDSVLGVEEFGLGPTEVDRWHMKGSVSAADGSVTISRFVLRAGDAEIIAKGKITDSFGDPAVRLSGTISPMPMEMFKQMWPRFLAGAARQWVLENVEGGQVLGGSFNVALKPGMLDDIKEKRPIPADAVEMDLKFTETSVAYIPELPPVRTGEGTLKLAGAQFSVDIPAGKVTVANGMEIDVSDGRFFVADIRDNPNMGVVTFRGAAPTPAVTTLLDYQPFGFITGVGLKPDFLGGTATGEFTFNIPLVENLNPRDIKIAGVAHLQNAITPGLVGDLAIEGGAVDVNLTSEGVSASGNVTIKGVPASVHWQRLFYAPENEQPPISVTSVLDAASREKLGLKVNDIVNGPMPVTLYLSGLSKGTGQPDTSRMTMVGDLTDAELVFHAFGWKKQPGQDAKLSFVVNKKPDGTTDLEDFQITGQNLAISGQVALDTENEIRTLSFPKFAFGTLTDMSIQAQRRDDGVMQIHAEGPSYDARDFFRTLISADQLTDSTKAESGDDTNIELTAKIGRLVGYDNSYATDVDVALTKRAGELVALNGRGLLGGQKSVNVELQHSDGARILVANADDAGTAFRLIGFYRSLQGGIASLRVNMDAGGVRKSGTLRVRDFAIVGDSVVADVLSDPSSAAALGQHQHDVKRQIVFKRLRAPFIAGGGKFQLDDAYVNGPELGATLRGTIDFNARKLDLGGTYVPLYGLNSALGAVPVLGRVLVGRQGEGVVGITFAIKGKLDDPTVLVNPMSVMTPGIFRQIFDFNSGVPQGTTSAGTETWGENTSTERPRKKRRLRPLQNARERRGLN